MTTTQHLLIFVNKKPHLAVNSMVVGQLPTVEEYIMDNADKLCFQKITRYIPNFNSPNSNLHTAFDSKGKNDHPLLLLYIKIFETNINLFQK